MKATSSHSSNTFETLNNMSNNQNNNNINKDTPNQTKNASNSKDNNNQNKSKGGFGGFGFIKKGGGVPKSPISNSKPKQSFINQTNDITKNEEKPKKKLENIFILQFFLLLF